MAVNVIFRDEILGEIEGRVEEVSGWIVDTGPRISIQAGEDSTTASVLQFSFPAPFLKELLSGGIGVSLQGGEGGLLFPRKRPFVGHFQGPITGGHTTRETYHNCQMLVHNAHPQTFLFLFYAGKQIVQSSL